MKLSISAWEGEEKKEKSIFYLWKKSNKKIPNKNVKKKGRGSFEEKKRLWDIFGPNQNF